MLELLGSGGLGYIGQTLRDAGPMLVAFAAAFAAFVLLSRLFGGGSVKRQGPGVAARLGSALAQAFTTNWQLTLLATTAFVLSIASGWTTWDGMRNFTGEPILSFLVTFGIQGVMLIIAWLIGESFASGMNQRSRDRAGDQRRGVWRQVEPVVGMLVGGLCAIGILALVANSIGAFEDLRAAATDAKGWSSFANKSLYLGVGLLLLATLLINQRSDVIQPYMQSARVIAKNAVLWVMFLSCMATSVFFSFDSLFSAIFPQQERKRAADIRAVRQVAGVVNDIGVLAARRQTEEAEQLFRSAGWIGYEKNLTALSRESQGAEQAIEQYFVQKMELRRRAIAEQQERMSNAKSGQAGLLARKVGLSDEISRLRGERPSLAADLAEKKTELENRNKGIDAKRVEAMAEERGAEGTLKVGKGPVYRQRKAELDQLQDAVKIQEERVRDAQKRVVAADSRFAQLERELAAVDGDLAKLKGEAETAEQRIAVVEQVKEGDGDSPKVDPARVRSAFERAHAEFRQDPTSERLAALANQCAQLQSAMLSTPATKDRVRSIDCDPKQAADAAGRVFALNAGLATFAQNCTGGARLPTSGDTDTLLEFGRKCLQDSGLATADSNDMAAKISAIDLNRDDKAHRFVVTWNAFTDGNRLAYLALAIAIAIDGLIFMSGLFGANAVRSPLTDIEDRGAMTADQLEATIDSALRGTAHPLQTLSALLRSLHPISGYGDFTSEIVLDEHDPLVDEMRQVLAMGVTIGAVRRMSDNRTQYLLHSGLVRYFAVALSKSWKVKSADVDKKDLVNVIGVALLPDPQANAEIVLSEMHPISDAQGFAAETLPYLIADDAKKRLVINTLGAGATVPGAVRRNNEDGRYFVSTDFYKTLLFMRAATIPAFRPDIVAARYASRGPAPILPHAAPPRALSQEAPRQVEDQGPAERGREDRDPPRRMQAHSSPGGPAVAEVPAFPPPLSAGSVAGRDTGRAQPMPRKPGSSRLASEIRAEIIQSGLFPWSDLEIENAWRGSSDRTLERAVWAVVGRERIVGARVEQAIRELRQNIEQAYVELRDRHSADPNYVQVLESEADRIKRLLPALMMTPSGPYEQILDELIRELRARGGILEDQAGNGALSEEELALLRQLQDHAYQLRSLSGSAADRDERLAQLLDRFRESTSSVDASMRGRPDSPLT